MSYWSWDPSLSVGIEVIDGQHRRIIDYINELDVAHIEKDREKVSDVLMGLVDYTKTHFSFEEQLMECCGYPLSDSHRKVHEAFIAHINRFVEEHHKGRDVTRRLMSELQLWLTNHIKRDDQDYAPYTRETIHEHESWISRTVSRLFGRKR